MYNKNVSVFKPVELVDGLYIGKPSGKSKPVFFDDFIKNESRSKVKIIGMSDKETNSHKQRKDAESNG